MKNEYQQPLTQSTPGFRWRRDVIDAHLFRRSDEAEYMSEPVRRCGEFVKAADLPLDI